MFPGLHLLDLILPADSLAPGAMPAQDVRWAAVANVVMSMPISAMMRSAVTIEMPGTVVSRSRCLASSVLEEAKIGAEAEGFEPPRVLALTAFKAVSFGRSDTPPWPVSLRRGPQRAQPALVNAADE